MNDTIIAIALFVIFYVIALVFAIKHAPYIDKGKKQDKGKKDSHD